MNNKLNVKSCFEQTSMSDVKMVGRIKIRLRYRIENRNEILRET